MKGLINSFPALQLTLSVMQAQAAGLPGQNLWLHGSLVAEACVIAPGNETVELSFGTIVVKYLDLNQRTPGVPFKLVLQNCAPDIVRSVTVKFSGNADAQGPLIPDSPALSWPLIRIEQANGDKVEINGAGATHELQKGVSEISLQARGQGKAEALKNNSIRRGEFTASSTFELTYH